MKTLFKAWTPIYNQYYNYWDIQEVPIVDKRTEYPGAEEQLLTRFTVCIALSMHTFNEIVHQDELFGSPEEAKAFLEEHFPGEDVNVWGFEQGDPKPDADTDWMRTQISTLRFRLGKMGNSETVEG